MTAEDFSLVEAIFAEALPLAADQRARVLQERCRGRTDLLHEVATLLQAHDVVAQSPDDEGRTAVHCGVGDRTGAYRLTELIGEGGMGVVFAAERADGAFVQKAAVKLTRSVLADPELQRRFKIERQILASLRHPNIVTLLDGGATPDGRGYLVMEYVEGLPLTQYCRDRALPLEERLNIFRDVCAAVQFAHQHGIVHRDLKPSNILVGADGVPKVLDFGVAKLLAPSVATDATIGIVPGLLTPNYASPEQLRGLPVTTTSDVYALGVVLYELLAGTRPYETAGQLLDRVMELVLHAPPVPPSEVRPDVAAGVPYPRTRLRGDLDAIVLKAMSKDTTHRYGSAGELASDIDRYLAGAPVLARAPSTAYVLRRLAARNKPLVTLGALALAAILVILGVALRQAQIARAERDRAQAEAAKAQQMAALLGGIFQSANPTQAPGEPVTARDLLDRATTSIANELKDQPDVHASLLLIMSDAYDRLTMEPTALELAQQSLHLREQALPAESLEVAESLHKVGRLHRRRRQTAQALPLLHRALALRETLFGYEHREVASTLREVALAQLDVADWTGGRQTLERAIRIEERVAPQSASLALLYNNLGNCLVAAGDWTSARLGVRTLDRGIRQG